MMTRRRPLLRLALASAAVALLGVAPAHAQTATAKIQPGVAIETDGTGCTLNWIYDRFVPDPESAQGMKEGVYAGTAAHCVEEVGQTVHLVTQPDEVRVLPIGSVAFIAPEFDYAFVRIADTNVELVDPSMKGHPQIPTGVSTTATTARGDIIQFSGNGSGFHLHEITRERRQGILNGNDGTVHEVIGPTFFGDSGGPVADISDGNKALGIVNWLEAGVGGPGTAHAGEGGLSLQGMLADALRHGWDMRVRTI